MLNINREYLLQLRGQYFEFVSFCFQLLARLFGFPEVPGMPLLPPQDSYLAIQEEKALSDQLPIRRIPFPPDSHPQNYFEILFGDLPKPATTPRIYYQSDNDGFYSYYIENYKNLQFLPNWFSEFLQINCNICSDISILELGREALFVVITVYYYILVLRITMGWFLAINPYVFPISYFVILVDWIDDFVSSFFPTFGGFGLGTPLLFIFMGKFADYVNNLVFTMPYLPSEGILEKTIIQGQVKDILTFKNLPYLWYKYPIPNEIREFWANERLDILKYMHKTYGTLDINFLPDRLKTIPISAINNLFYKIEQIHFKDYFFTDYISEQILTNTSHHLDITFL